MPHKSGKRTPETLRIPHYLLYGDHPEQQGNWLLNIESLAKRCKDRGWQIEPHSHPNFGQIVIVRSGSGKLIIEDRSLDFESPCAMVIPMHCVHGFNYEADTDGWVLTVAEYYLHQIKERLPEFTQLWSEPSITTLHHNGNDLAEIRTAITMLEHELEVRALGHMIATELHLMSIFLKLLRCMQSKIIDESLNADQAKLVEAYRALIEKNYLQNWKIGDFTDKLGVSNSQLRTACDLVCGKAPIKMLHDRKLIEAKRNLVFSDLKIEQIAYSLGFSSPAYFTRFFKKELGVSPVQFRVNSQ